MFDYIWIFGWLAVMTMLAPRINVNIKKTVTGEKEFKLDYRFALVTMLPLIICAGTRSNAFGDTFMYANSFNALPDTFNELISYVAGVSKDKGFSVLSGIIKIIVGNRTQVYFLILATIQGICLASIYWKYSENYFLSLFLFVASTDYLSWMFNGLRQFTAATIIFAATGLMLKKKYIPLIAVILLASTIHGSALMMLPIVFIVQGKAWNKKTILVILGCILALFFVDSFTNILDTALSDTQYTNVVKDWVDLNDDGTNLIRVVVYAIPALLSFICRKGVEKADDPVVNMATNMSIISTGIYLVSSVTSGVYIGRLPIFCSLYSYILLPWEINHLFEKRSARMTVKALIVLYLIFYMYQTGVAWG